MATARRIRKEKSSEKESVIFEQVFAIFSHNQDLKDNPVHQTALNYENVRCKNLNFDPFDITLNAGYRLRGGDYRELACEKLIYNHAGRLVLVNDECEEEGSDNDGISELSSHAFALK